MRNIKLEILGIFKQYNVRNDKDLLIAMAKDALTIHCIQCGKKIKIEKARYIGGDPYCKACS
jgi:formylmethanofuran dehydrogenase subunit E